jgi:hypothetical protein
MCIDREAHIVFKAGKNHDGYFDSNDLLAQVDKAIDIFEERTHRFVTGLFCLIMLQAIKSMQLTHFLLARCPRIQIVDGHTRKVALACDRLLSPMDRYRNFSLQMTIRNTQAFSKEWN